MSSRRKLFICLILLSIPFLGKLPMSLSAKADLFHSDLEKAYFEMMVDSLLPKGFNSLFAGSGECIQCHGYDTAQIASVNLLGEDINLVDDWRASMMANSAKDPFWRAKVSHEVLLYPQHQEIIENKCTSCHAPLGHFAAMHDGQQYYSMAEMLGDSIAQDGVSCLACHQQSQLDLGNLNSGHLNFDTAKIAYGPFISPLESPMVMATDYKPVFSEHISDAGICAGCHTLITETLDYDGNFTGASFVEQATYHEWLNSTYEVDNVTCQSCHMEAMAKGQVLLAAGFDTEARTPFYLHELAGANVFMLKMFRDNIEELGLAATEDQFNQAILATEDMLYNKSISMNLIELERTIDTAFFEMNIANLAGHKFPSGYPSRRVFIEFLVINEVGDTVFISGKTDDDFEVVGHDTNYEPHYDIIRSEDEVQIYEMVVSDVNDDVTTVLVRGEYSFKDNRIPPEGFSSNHSTYDTVQIRGLANMDANFNQNSDGEGTGADKIYFHVPLDGENGALQATAKVYYQTAPPKWMQELFEEESEEIDKFRVLFDAADRQPILIKEKSVDVGPFVSIENIEETNIFVEIISNLLSNGEIAVRSDEIHSYYIYDIDGTLLQSKPNNSGNYNIPLKASTGLYIIRFVNQNGDSIIKKIIIP
jgi:nitrate/TMAO reductase-like tetraheme cytochrome c subunit